MDDFDRLGLEMERECMIATFQALVETIGSEKAIKLLRSYFELSGRAYALNLANWTKDDPVFDKIAKLYVMGQTPWGNQCKSFIIREGEAFFESEGCLFLGTIPEICECICNIMWESVEKQIDPDLEVELKPGTGRDNPRCKWRSYFRTRNLSSDLFIKDLDIDLIASQISEEELTWRSHHYIGGIWEMVIYAMVTGLGSEAVLDSLSDYMKRNGFAFGLRIKHYLDIEERDLNAILTALDVYGKAVCQQHVPLTIGEDEIRIEVKDCLCAPCVSDYATPEHCQLIEKMNDGICMSINPDYEFRYEYMKTKGDDSCIWTVKKKTINNIGQTRDTRPASSDQDLLNILKTRLAKGEISIEQYEKIVQVLK